MAKSPEHVIDSVRPVGRYALGVVWSDRHDSIFPFANLRRSCPCDTCRAAPEALPTEGASTLASVERYEDASVLLRWADGHETLLLNEELRALCGCARCKGEPDYPITGQ